MNNNDLIKQYIDTGLNIPKYQMDKLSNNFLDTYLRKRIIAAQHGNHIKDYEYNIMNNTQKESTHKLIYERLKEDMSELEPWERNLLPKEYQEAFKIQELLFKIADNQSENEVKRGSYVKDDWINFNPDGVGNKDRGTIWFDIAITPSRNKYDIEWSDSDEDTDDESFNSYQELHDYMVDMFLSGKTKEPDEDEDDDYDYNGYDYY